MTSNNHNNYSTADIRRYVNGQMSAEEMNALEKAALEDPFLSDAIDGFREAAPGQVEHDLEDLQHRLANRITKENKRPTYLSTSWWKIAALFILLAGAGGLYYSLTKDSDQDYTTIAKNEAMQPAPPIPDSLSTDIISLNEPATPPNAEQPGTVKATDESNSKQDPAGTNRDEVATSESKAKTPAAGKRRAPSPALMERNQNADEPAPEAFKKEKAEERQIMSDQVPPEMMNTNNFRGRVVNDSNTPVAGASVMVLNSQLGLSTDSNGYFNFSFVDTAARIAISTPGYSPARATIKNNIGINEIKLHSVPLVKEEMVARRSSSGSVSQSTSPAPEANGAVRSGEPVTGWKDFEKYLEKNRVVPGNLRTVHGETVLSFIVDSSGRPSQFVIEKSLNPGLDLEAIRLVREGPSWKVTNAANAKGRVTIRF